MSMERWSTYDPTNPVAAARNYKTGLTLAADEVLASTSAVKLRDLGTLQVQAVIDNGAGIAPTSTPVGTWELYGSADGVNFSRDLDATAELAKIAAQGNVLVSSWAKFVNAPGIWVKLVYKRGSGGGAGASCTVNLVV